MSSSPYIRAAFSATVLLALAGCDFFNSIGEHMPVIGQRCENWQCFTQSGQEQSELNKERMQGTPSAASSGRQTPVENAPAVVSSQPPVSAPVESANPQAPASPALTPFDMTPEQLQNMPPPKVP